VWIITALEITVVIVVIYYVCSCSFYDRFICFLFTVSLLPIQLLSFNKLELSLLFLLMSSGVCNKLITSRSKPFNCIYVEQIAEQMQ